MTSEPLLETQPARVFIAESAELVRRGIRATLSGSADVTIVGETSWPQEVTGQCQRLLPDLTIIGISRSERSFAGEPGGLNALRQTLHANPNTLAIALVDADDVKNALQAIRTGAKGVLLRSTDSQAMLEAVRDVLDGGCALDPRLTRSIFEYIAHGNKVFRMGNSSAKDSSEPTLSARELDVLEGMAKGLGNKEIAAHLGVRPGTAKTHVAHIFAKLKVNDRTSAVLFAMRAGLLDVTSY